MQMSRFSSGEAAAAAAGAAGAAARGQHWPFPGDSGRWNVPGCHTDKFFVVVSFKGARRMGRRRRRKGRRMRRRRRKGRSHCHWAGRR